jgi:hypothetical protein
MKEWQQDYHLPISDDKGLASYMAKLTKRHGN